MRISFKNASAVVAIVAMIAVTPFVENYSTLYFIMLSILVIPSMATNDFSTRALCGVLFLYFGFALLNISDYRNYVSTGTIRLYIASTFFFALPLLVFPARPTHWTPARKAAQITTPMLVGHLVIVWLCVAYVYMRWGAVIIKQDLRFLIPTALGYVIRSAAFVPVCFAMMSDFRSRRGLLSLITALSVTPPLLIGSRSTAALGLLGVALYFVAVRAYGWSGDVGRKRRMTWRSYAMAAAAGIACYSVISGGFYLRRANTDQLMSGEQFVSGYLSAYPRLLMYGIAPLYQGFNETASLTSRIVEQKISNGSSSLPLILADFNNLFGISSTSAAQYFGDSVGRAQDGGLTPGLLGAILLDYPTTFFVWFFAFSCILALVRSKAMSDRAWLCVYVVCLLQMIHLFQRGFIKPEYFSTILIVAIYAFSTRRTAPDSA